MYIHGRLIAVVPIDMAIHQMSTKHTTDIVHVFIICGYMHVGPTDESCRYCYDLCSLENSDCFLFGRFGTSYMIHDTSYIIHTVNSILVRLL